MFAESTAILRRDLKSTCDPTRKSTRSLDDVLDANDKTMPDSCLRLHSAVASIRPLLRVECPASRPSSKVLSARNQWKIIPTDYFFLLA
jgi:hypothetical protein